MCKVLLLEKVSSPHLGNRKRFPCLYSLTNHEVRYSYANPQLSLGFVQLLRVFLSAGYAYTVKRFLTREKKIELFVYGNDKGEILTSRKVLYTKFCKRNYIKLLFCKKDTFQNKDFSLLNVSLSEKNN